MSSNASNSVPEHRLSNFLQLAPTQSHSSRSSSIPESGPSGFLQLVPTQSAPYTSSVPERRLSSFLSLAPTQSASYPQIQRSLQQAKVAPTALEAEVNRQRRSSSLSSVGSSNSGLRFLKLGPVHWGEHQEDHQGDFAIE
ncbi:hypothetical protein MAPG_06823 [Magnaporthiopsis poae ATCC 64411]|uniref:Uncharacterized protein n=1 Tax=Magnaporthiopsis poae (strain ATCC 64411 / 73-15) TaxID=644358 RepID=A0A0C4E331_MAGP6|nr:hypothetical protein MAPG_06823 [Magnaporthiopsis poae ATCC 64411]